MHASFVFYFLGGEGKTDRMDRKKDAIDAHIFTKNTKIGKLRFPKNLKKILKKNIHE